VNRQLVTIMTAAALMAGSATTQAAAPSPAAGEAAFRAIYKEMVETDSSFASGSCTAVAEKMAARMKAAGFPEKDLTLFAPAEQPKAGGLVAVFPGTDPKAKAVLMLGHIDVVNAFRADWVRDPYTLIEEDGYFYGRGTTDMKAQSSIWVDNMIRFHQEGYKPKRTIKMALTCGEEGGGFVNGARWLTENKRELIDAALALNEGGGGELDASGKRIDQTVQAAQKVVMSFTLEATNPGGHSSRPRPDNAIYSLVRALEKLSQNDFPVQFNDANRAYFTSMAPIVGGEVGAAMKAIVANPNDKAADALLSKDPSLHTVLRTTCVATMAEAGHAGNALPQRARATINCRVMPEMPMEEVQATLTKWINDPEVKVLGQANSRRRAPPAPLTEQVMGPIKTVSNQMWPGVPVVANMSAGATDAVSLNAAGIPTYGVSGVFRDPDGGNAHGLNERVRVRSVMEGREFLYRLVKAYAEQAG
jgi:acetylornithine deacetylase/succinyl-diaminopimelate desuccinylase-like protein